MSKEVLTPLAAARASRGLSLADVSKAVNYDRGGLSRIERGIARPRPALCAKLSTFFQITRDEIMYPEEHTGVTSKKRAGRSRGVELQEAS